MSDLNMQKSIREEAKRLVSQMTLEEKVSLCSGMDFWTTKPIERLGLPAVMMADGPHGLRKQTGSQDNLGIGDSVPAVCFPTASASACSFDRELLWKMGEAMAEECLQEGVSIILGPGANQKRSPLCGRNFEYFSEDPLLSGELAAGMIQGIQSRGIGASLKHFALNNQEKRRQTIDVVSDERTMRETYLKAFEIAVKKGKPATVMCAYNRVNGVYCSENKRLLTDILRQEWGFEGAVISDWGAVCDRVTGVKAGMDLEMPGNQGINDLKVKEAVLNHMLEEKELDLVACRVTELILSCVRSKKPGYTYQAEEHHQLAVYAAEQSTVLLKNEGHLLPGSTEQKVAVIGEFAKHPRYQGAGSSKIHPLRVESAWETFLEYGVDAVYAAGYRSKSISQKKQEELMEEACALSKGKDMVYLFAGLPEGYESEGFDRTNLSLPEEQNRLIEKICEHNQNVVVILSGGAPMTLPWIDKVKAAVMTYLGGEGVGRAVTNILLGRAVPCGKLAETWPKCIEDTPAFHYFPGGRISSEYRESIYVGYRYYEKSRKEVQFPFGHGLSYTDFFYSDLDIEKEKYEAGEKIRVTFTVTNKGSFAAKETAMIFVSHKSDTVFQPEKELREFVKIALMPGEAKQISLLLDTTQFGYYNTLLQDFYTESGKYEIMVGSSSEGSFCKKEVSLCSTACEQPDFRKEAASYYLLGDGTFRVDGKEFQALYGKELPENDTRIRRPYNKYNTLEQVRHTLVGKIIILYADMVARKITKTEKEQMGMMSAMIKEMPFYAMVTSGDSLISESMMEGMLDLLNGHYIKGFKKLFK